MKLTGWFSQDKITDNSKVQTTDTQNAEQVSRQIRTLVPGQTIRGEVVSREGNNAQIRLLQDVLIDARVDADIRLDLGQNITFQVKNNGQVLSLSPLFTNMATEGTVLKALEMASLPTNESTVAMTKQLMDAGFPIDKNTLQQIWHESNVFPEAVIEDIVNLHRLELPVTEENLTQMASYRNLTYQLTEGITAVAESLNSTLQGLTTNGEIEQAATIYGHILELLIPGEENPEAQRATVQFPDPEQTETVLQPGEPMSQTKEAIAHTDTAVTNGTPEASKTMLPTQKMIVDGTGRCRRSGVEAFKTGIGDQGHCFTAQCFTEFQNSRIAGRIVAGCMEYPTGGCGIFGEGGRTLSETWKTVKESGGSSGRKRTKQFQRFSGGDKFKPECGFFTADQPDVCLYPAPSSFAAGGT